MEQVFISLIVICCLGLVYSSIQSFLRIRRMSKRQTEVRELLKFLRKDEGI